MPNVALSDLGMRWGRLFDGRMKRRPEREELSVLVTDAVIPSVCHRSPLTARLCSGIHKLHIEVGYGHAINM